MSKNSRSSAFADELLEWKALLDEGVITQAEYDARKKKLFDSTYSSANSVGESSAPPTFEMPVRPVAQQPIVAQPELYNQQRFTEQPERTDQDRPGISFLRNLAYALASFFALSLVYWLLTLLFMFIFNWVISLDLVVAIIVLVIFGGLIFWLFKAVSSLLLIPLTLLSLISRSLKFVSVWTVICVVINIVLTCIWFWPPFVSVGAAGIIAAIVLTLDFIGLGATLCTGTIDVMESRMEDEIYRG